MPRPWRIFPLHHDEPTPPDCSPPGPPCGIRSGGHHRRRAPVGRPRRQPAERTSRAIDSRAGSKCSPNPTGFAERAASEGACWIPGNLARERDLAAGPGAAARDRRPALDPDVAADFLALGYCYLQVRAAHASMRYSTNLDESQFFRRVVAGAKAAVAGDRSTARDRLAACFDLLAQNAPTIMPWTRTCSTSPCSRPIRSRGTGHPARRTCSDELLLTGQLLGRDAPAGAGVVRGSAARALRRLPGTDGGWNRRKAGHLSTAARPWLRRSRPGCSSLIQLLAAHPRVYARRQYGVSVLFPQLL